MASAPVCAPADGVNPCVPESPSGAYKILLFDASCDAEESSDSAFATWTHNAVPSAVYGDQWGDASMAINDADYSTIAYIDVDVEGPSGPPGISLFTFPTMNTVSPISPIGDASSAVQAAITSGAGKILVVGPATGYPQLSFDGGATFTDATGLPSGKSWTQAAFSAGAGAMYVAPLTNSTPLYKSVDGLGAVWSPLSASPLVSYPASNITGRGGRLRTDTTGQVVAAWVGYSNHGVTTASLWVSTDGGATTHSSTDFTTMMSAGTPEFSDSDFGMSPDGSVMIVGGWFWFPVGGGTPYNLCWLSLDQGTTWTPVTLPAHPPDPSTGLIPRLNVVNVAPDNQGLFGAYWDTVAGHQIVDWSTNQGATWSTSDTAPVASIRGQWINGWMLPN